MSALTRVFTSEFRYIADGSSQFQRASKCLKFKSTSIIAIDFVIYFWHFSLNTFWGGIVGDAMHIHFLMHFCNFFLFLFTLLLFSKSETESFLWFCCYMQKAYAAGAGYFNYLNCFFWFPLRNISEIEAVC